MKTKVVEVWCALVMSVVLAGCADTDYDWDSVRSENSQYNYAYNFEHIYGAIDLNQSWDFSSLGNNSGTRAEGDVTATQSAGIYFGVDNTVTGSNPDYTIKSNLSNNTTIYNDLIANTTYNGAYYESLTVKSSDEFTIYPVVTTTNLAYKMFVQVGDNEPIEIFEKDWTRGKNSSNTYCNGMGIDVSDASTYGTWDGILYTIKNDGTNKYLDGTSITSNSKNASKYAIIKGNDGKMYLYSVENKSFLRSTDWWSSVFIGLTKWITIKQSISLQAVDFSNATPLDTTEGRFKLGQFYLFSTEYLFNSDIIGLRGSSSATNSTWSWTKCQVSDTEAMLVRSALEAKKPFVSEVAEMHGVTIAASDNMPIDIFVQLVEEDGTVSTSRYGTGNGNSRTLTYTGRPTELNKDGQNETDPNKSIKYVGINMDDNTSFSDLVFAIVGKTGSLPSFGRKSKRYMVEDMGFAMPGSQAVEKGYTDIDFNDIVVDFETTMNSNHQITTTAIIRALGGTWDFVLSLNKDNSLTPIFWKRESRTTARTVSTVSIPAVVPNTKYPLWGNNFDKFNVGTMYNTGRSSQNNGDNHYVLAAGKKTQNGQLVNQANWDESWLCKIENVQGWDYNANNLVFTLIDSEADDLGFSDLFNSETDVNNVYFKSDYQFAFPAIGAVPKIVAFDTNKEWRQERVHVNKEWFERTTLSTANIPYDYDYSSGSSDD